MNVVLGMLGASPGEVHAARRLTGGAVDATELWHDDGTLLLLSADSPSVAASGRSDSAAVATVGSGVRLLPVDPATSTLDELLGGSGLDLASVQAGKGSLSCGVTGVNQRLFHAHLPGGGVVVGSHLLTVARLAGATTDRSFEDFFLSYGFHPDSRTTYGGVSALGPGRRVEWIPNRAVEHRAIPATAADEEPPPSRSAAIDGLRDRFFDALERQAGSDRRHAVMLGGFDSALVASGLRRLGHEVHTFTFGFGDPQYEQRNVDLVVSSLDTTHHVVRIDADEVMSGLEELPGLLNQPGVQPHYQLHTILASRRIREEGFAHAFSGDGCDAVFLGYPTVNARARLLERLGRVPTPAVRAALAGLSLRPIEDHLGHVARIGRSTLSSRVLGTPAGGHLPSACLDGVAIDRLRRDHPDQVEPVEETRQRLASGLDQLDPIRLAFHGNGLNGQSRVKVEGAVMATGVAHSSPFTDARLKTYATALPVELLRPGQASAGDLGKALLIEMVLREGLLDERIVRQPKQSPSDSPIDLWYMGALRPRVLELLEGLPFPYDHDYVRGLLRPSLAEEQYRRRVSISHHALSAVGLLSAYAAFHRAVT